MSRPKASSIAPRAQLRIEISSGVDWFDLHGSAEFGDSRVSLPKLLRAIKQGEHTVRLDDGSLGIIPEEWLAKYRLLADLGSARRRTFALHAAAKRDCSTPCSPTSRRSTSTPLFERVREELKAFAGVKAADPSRGVSSANCAITSAKAWAGCSFFSASVSAAASPTTWALARPSRCWRCWNAPRAERLVATRTTAPRRRWSSCRDRWCFNWMRGSGALHAEAACARPHRRRTAPSRASTSTTTMSILTTYGTLRRDVAALQRRRVSTTCILDEAQAIKNASTRLGQGRAAAQADHRLALSGTPWKITWANCGACSSFSIPGMLGGAIGIRLARRARNPMARRGSCWRRRCGRLSCAAPKSRWPKSCRRRPSRRSTAIWKPASASSTTSCAIIIARSLLSNVDTRRDDTSPRFQVLEALLRLRQAACHPGLIDKASVEAAEREARRAAGAVGAGAGRRSQGAGVFAVHQPAGDRARPARRREDYL